MLEALVGLGGVGLGICVLAVAVWLWMMVDGKRETLDRAERERQEDQANEDG